MDSVPRKIGNKYFDFVFDDEGKLKEHYVSGMMADRSDYFAGNLLIFGRGEYNWESINDDDIPMIETHMRFFNRQKDNKVVYVMDGIEY